MSFFREVRISAPGYNPNLPWPLHGLAYVIMFGGGFAGGMGVGLIVGHWIGLGIGFMVGVVIALSNAWLFDFVVERWIVKFQSSSRWSVPWVLVNVCGFAWAISVCGISACITLGFLYRMGAPRLGQFFGGHP